MRLFFLEASQPLTKRFWRNEEGQLEKDPYPYTKKFVSHEESVTNIEQFEAAIKAHAHAQHCLLKGQLNRRLVWESRAGTTNPLDMTHWVVFDLDDLLGFTDPEEFINEVLPKEFHDASYILQHSASSGIVDDGIRAHLFFMLATPASPEIIKNWVTCLNLNTPRITNNLQLSANAFTLKYPCDITVNQNDKLIYIAPPLLGDGVEDSLQGKRINLVRKGQEQVDFDFPFGEYANLQVAVDDRIAELRERMGLPKRTPKYKYFGDVKVLTNPGKAYVTSEKEARGFTYLNLNGGDSWGYYYPTDNPKLLFNFKCEPVVVLRDFLPDYYQQIQGRLGAEIRDRPMVFRDPTTDVYYNGVYDPVNDRIRFMYPCGSKDRLKDFLEQYALDMPDPVPDWTYEFRPHDDAIIDPDQRFLNRYQPSDTWRYAGEEEAIPPMVNRVLRSVVGDDQECYDLLLNWLACVAQYRVKIGTAWILQGVQGTGKGLLVNEIMRPILGEEYCRTRLLGDFDDKFNAELETCLLMNVDEARISDISNSSKTVNMLKNLITEESVKIRGMRQNARDVHNYTNFIFSSNNYDVIAIDANDRRFNVAPRQETRLLLSETDVQQLRTEVPLFAGFLKSCKADMDLARQALNNKAKDAMRLAGQDTNEQFATALTTGDIGFFVAFAQAPPMASDMLVHSEYKRIVDSMLKDALAGRPTITHINELMLLHRYLVGARPQGPTKFGRMLAHKNVIIEQNQLIVKWQDAERFRERQAA